MILPNFSIYQSIYLFIDITTQIYHWYYRFWLAVKGSYLEDNLYKFGPADLKKSDRLEFSTEYSSATKVQWWWYLWRRINTLLAIVSSFSWKRRSRHFIIARSNPSSWRMKLSILPRVTFPYFNFGYFNLDQNFFYCCFPESLK